MALMLSCQSSKESTQSTQDLTEGLTTYVNPMIGTGGHGHTFPGAATPSGMVQLSPDTYNKGWDWCSGYHYTDGSIMGFTHTHLSGTGRGDYLDILFMPVTGDVKFKPGTRENPDEGYRSRFSHENENASPGFYEVYLDDYSTLVELTVSPRVGFHRYTFPEAENKHVIVDLEHTYQYPETILESFITIIDDSTIIGLKRSKGWAKDQHVYFAARFSEPFNNHGILREDDLVYDTQKVEGKSIKAHFDFPDDLEQLMVKVAISPVSTEGAIKNLNKEISHWDFEKVKNQANDAWEKELSRIRIQTEDEKKKEIFYTGMYHSMLFPSLYTDSDGKYRGLDQKIHQADGFNRYTVFSLWDTFRATHPLFTLIKPDHVSDLIRSMLAHYDEYGLLPEWSLSSTETYTMIGYHAVPVIVDAYFKGIRDYDVDKAYEAIVSSALQEQHGVDLFHKHGYIPADLENKSVSKALEYAYDDWCVARIANELGKEEDRDKFLAYSQNYKNHFDPSTGFMRGKKRDGSWVTPFSPTHSDHRTSVYIEGNAWQYSWFVPHDVRGLVGLFEEEEAFISKLDSLFTLSSTIEGSNVSKDISGLIGQYAHGNEPSHHVAYLYNYAGAPWKAQERLYQIMTELYDNTPDGLSGNEDCGQMSSWYVLSSMGLYPVNPADGNYVFGTPMFDRTEIQLDEGKTFTIEAENLSEQNYYIQEVSLNGEPYTRTYLPHNVITKGGKLLFVMGPEPNPDYGSSPEDYPPSHVDAF
jgi:predicted alpha-1,2-mannosidase